MLLMHYWMLFVENIHFYHLVSKNQLNQPRESIGKGSLLATVEKSVYITTSGEKCLYHHSFGLVGREEVRYMPHHF